jgi:hypothetical protein
MLWKGSRKDAVAEPPTDSAAAVSLPCALLARFLQRVGRFHPAPNVLMLGELCGANVTFLGERGFRVRVERDLEAGAGDAYAGALVWDTLSMMPPTEARRRAAILFDRLEEGGAVLAFFGSTAPAAALQRERYRIISENLIRPELVKGRVGRRHPYQNREIIGLFERFDLDLLHTHKNGQREVLFVKKRQPATEV